MAYVRWLLVFIIIGATCINNCGYSYGYLEMRLSETRVVANLKLSRTTTNQDHEPLFSNSY